MNGWLSRGYRWMRRPRSRGQAMAEFTVLLMVFILTGVSITTFAPDMFAALTIYIRGFYCVLGYPFG
ncbi:hypothetical protein [Corallococcus exiguus]|uniref:Uncharacterized protein n=1 Tax=Corallococcus exiguus TaxID=83462 RepID=A0A7X4YHB7_9BACT|nr:hypothetical protein [Corallococcus exiguus]NBC45310.1 hypothetical protein [Corallococcus exiguus]TNV61639.1 hypothetical protein FH620_20490 [Corallococcus exiguus]